MGTSTDGILLWGIALEDEGLPESLLDLDEEGDEEVAIARLYGLEYDGKDDKYWEAKEKLLKEIGCELVNRCSYDCPMYVAAVSASVKRCWRGEPTAIKNLNVGEDWEPKLRAFCKKLGIKWTRPKWLLCSFWGLDLPVHRPDALLKDEEFGELAIYYLPAVG